MCLPDLPTLLLKKEFVVGRSLARLLGHIHQREMESRARVNNRSGHKSTFWGVGNGRRQVSIDFFSVWLALSLCRIEGRMNRRSTKIVLHIYFTENLGDGLSR